MKTAKAILRLILIAVLISAAFLCGIYTNQYKRNQEENKSTITTIAVVNTDSGVVIDGEKINYAAKLISYPDTNFATAGLAEAREGILNNRYAAYILIPGNFSSSIESINGEPEKANLTYEINQNLREDAKIKVINDIHNFTLNLSTNVSYMYVDAILREVHNVQNDSLSIMKNDTKDMEAIAAVAAEDLIQAAEYDPLTIVETQIDFLDLAADFELVNLTVDSVYDTYEENMMLAADEFSLIKESGEIIGEEAVLLAEVFAGVDILLDEDGNSVYETGEENLLKLTEEFAENAEGLKTEAKKTLGYKEEDDPAPPDSTPLEELLEEVDKQIEVVNGLLAVLQGEDNLEEPISRALEDDTGVITEEDLEDIVIGLMELKTSINTYSANAITAIDDIPDVSTIKNKVEKIIDEEIFQPIMGECSTEAENVAAAINQIQTVITGHVEELVEYDALSYIETDIISDYMSSLYEIIMDMEEDIVEQDESYLEYIDEVVTTTDNNLTSLQESLDMAFTNTEDNVMTAMSLFKESRTDLNEQNMEILNGITGKLLYTRLGNLAYTQVYDFIVNPVIEDNQSQEQMSGISPTSVNIDLKEIFFIFIGIIALSFLYTVVLLIHRKNNDDILSGEEEEQWQTD